MLHIGGSIGYWRGDIKGLTDDIATLRPTIFAGVPRVFDRIYAGVMAKMDESFLKKFLFNWGYHRKLDGINKGVPQDKVSLGINLFFFLGLNLQKALLTLRGNCCFRICERCLILSHPFGMLNN